MGKRMTLLAVFFIFLYFVFLPGFASAEKAQALGKYDFFHYYHYEELTNYLKDLNEAYPQLTELKSLCKSPKGRDVWMLIPTWKRIRRSTAQRCFGRSLERAGPLA